MNYTVRLLASDDLDAFEKYLAPHTAEAYYLRSNAVIGGLSYEGRFYQAEYFGAFREDKLVGVLAYSWLDTILVYADEEDCIAALCQAVIPSLRARRGTLTAILGLAPLARAVLKGLSIPESGLHERHNDGLFKLNIRNLIAPALLDKPDYTVRYAEAKDTEQLVAWRMSFNMEAMNATSGTQLEARVREEISRRLDRRELFVLSEGDNVLAFNGAGGYVKEGIMIGPVWTPPELRGRGYAKAVTAGAIRILAEERPSLEWAALFAYKPDAIRVYESLGFQRIADYGLIVLKDTYQWKPAEKENRAQTL